MRCVIKIPTLKCLVFRMQKSFQTMIHDYGNRSATNVLKEKSGVIDINSSEWRSELDFVYINIKTGEKRLK